MKKLLLILTLFIFFALSFTKVALSWNPKITHRDFSLYASEKSVLSTNNGDYLKNQLGFKEGLDEKILFGETHDVKEWLAKGALEEDYAKNWLEILLGDSRFYNHYHNPLKLWPDAGLDNSIFSGMSSLIWAQNEVQQTFHMGDQSWRKVREFYYYALIATSDAERQMNYAQTFKGLGHQMHLIQDAAQPDHVRNDKHLFSYDKNSVLTLEAWAADKYRNLPDLKAFIPSNVIVIPTLPDPSLLTLDPYYDSNNLAPTALFIDTDQYDVNNPAEFFSSGLATSETIGIAEYTNANFFSPDTIFYEDETDPWYFPYPNKSITNYQVLIDNDSLEVVKYVEAEDFITEPTIYISKNNDVTAGEYIEYFVKPTYTLKERLSYTGGPAYKLDFYLDEKCHGEYAKHLMPRAVGYSAGLLNYFFRGKIAIDYTSEDTFRIENQTDEDMEGLLSSFKLYYDDINGNRYEIPLRFYDLLWNEYTDPNQLFLIPAQSTSTFQAVHDGTALNPKVLGEYMFVFKGRLGDEGIAPYDQTYAVAAYQATMIMNILQTGTNQFQIVNLSNKDIEGNPDSFTLQYEDTSGVFQDIGLLFYDEGGTQYASDATLTVTADTKSAFTAELQGTQINPMNPGDYLLKFKGEIGDKGTAPYDVDYAETEVEITPHFTIYAEEDGQWDIYEYDLNGVRIYNLTGGLPRGPDYYSAIPNPVDPDMFVYLSDSGCAGNWSCLHLMTKSNELSINLLESDVPWWSNDGTIIHTLRNGYYDVTQGVWDTSSTMLIPPICGYDSYDRPPPSFSDYESRLAMKATYPYGPIDSDVIIYTDYVLSHIVDMTTTSMVSVPEDYSTDCSYSGDEGYNDDQPDYHPTEDIIIFSSNVNGTTHQIYKAYVSAGSIQKLTTDANVEMGYFHAAWSPDGQQILMVGLEKGESTNNIYIMPESGGTPAKITKRNVAHFYPRWIEYLGQ